MTDKADKTCSTCEHENLSSDEAVAVCDKLKPLGAGWPPRRMAWGRTEGGCTFHKQREPERRCGVTREECVDQYRRTYARLFGCECFPSGAAPAAWLLLGELDKRPKLTREEVARMLCEANGGARGTCREPGLDRAMAYLEGLER